MSPRSPSLLLLPLLMMMIGACSPALASRVQLRSQVPTHAAALTAAQALPARPKPPKHFHFKSPKGLFIQARRVFVCEALPNRAANHNHVRATAAPYHCGTWQSLLSMLKRVRANNNQ